MKPIKFGPIAKWAIRQTAGTQYGGDIIAFVENENFPRYYTALQCLLKRDVSGFIDALPVEVLTAVKAEIAKRFGEVIADKIPSVLNPQNWK